MKKFAKPKITINKFCEDVSAAGDITSLTSYEKLSPGNKQSFNVSDKKEITQYTYFE